MNRKNILIILLVGFIVVVSICILYFIFFNNRETENKNINRENQSVDFSDILSKSKIQDQKNSEIFSKIENLEKNRKTCGYDQDCVKDIFLNCNIGTGLVFTNKGSYLLSVALDLFDVDNCHFNIEQIDDQKKYIFCIVNKELLNGELFEDLYNNGISSGLLMKNGCSVGGR